MPPPLSEGAEVLIFAGYAQWLHGQIARVDASFSEPFVEVIERRSQGRLAKTMRHLVPARFVAVWEGAEA